jgi:hypothetical protein
MGPLHDFEGPLWAYDGPESLACVTSASARS